MRFTQAVSEDRIRALEERVRILEKAKREDGGGCWMAVVAIQILALAAYGLYRLVAG